MSLTCKDSHLGIGEIQIKATMSTTLHPIRWG